MIKSVINPGPVKPDEPKPPAPGWKYAEKAAENFRPKGYPVTTEMLNFPDNIPTVLISLSALLKIHIVISAIELEVGWLGTARQTGNDIKVNDIFLFNQDVSYGHTELAAESMADIMQEVLRRPDGEDTFNNTRFWGHSHGNGGTYPSGQDNDQMKLFRTFGADFFLRGIFSRNGEINFSVYDWKRGIAFHEVHWKVVDRKVSREEYTAMRHSLRKEMREKVIYAPPPVYVAAPNIHNITETTIYKGLIQKVKGARRALRNMRKNI